MTDMSFNTEAAYAPDAKSLDSKSGLPTKQSKDAEKVVSWIKTNFINIKMARSYIERQWYLNLCFYYGKQNVVFRQLPNLQVGASGSLYVPPAPYWRARPVINKIRPIIRTEIAKLTSQKPSAFIVPASSDDMDLFAANAGEQIWDTIYREKSLTKAFRRWSWWTLICGTAFMKCYWDDDKQDENAQVDQEMGPQGDLCYDVVTPFHLFAPDFREEDIENQPFLIHAHVKSDDWVKLNFPDIKYSSSLDKENEILNQSWLNLVGAQDMRGLKGVLVLEAWVKPGANAMFPNGAMCTVVGDTLVQHLPYWPYEHNLFPFAKFDHIPSGKFYSDSSIVDLIPLQREFNRTRGQIIEAKNRMAKPMLLAEKGAIDPGKMTTEPGQIVEIQPGYQFPKPLDLPSLPNYVVEELERLQKDFDDLSGQHEVSRGQVPPGVTAATAINFLQEQDETMMSHTFQSFEEAIEKIAKMTLTYVHQFWDIPRMIKTVGTDGTFDATAFKGSDLRGNTDIRIEGGSSLPTSRAAKQAFIMDLMKLGFIDPNQGLQVMEMGGMQKIYESVQVDVRQAQRENLRMAAVSDESMQLFEELQMEQQQEAEMNAQATGQEPPQPSNAILIPVHTYDNHPLHIVTHDKYRKSQAFENLPDAAKQLFEDHVNQHKASMQQNFMAQQSGIPAADPSTNVPTPPMMPPPGPGPGNQPGPNQEKNASVEQPPEGV